ncbi:MAG: VOC family protein [Acetobacteraceae bacterium]|nr:VOC family protein [Acetobacteraceae bacterium]
MQKKFDPKTFQLGYLALGTPDIDRTKDHYLKLLGMTEVSRGDDGSVYLSIGYNHHDLVLRPTKQKALLHVGFQLRPHISVNDLAREARDLGFAADVKTDSQPGLGELVEVEAPGGLPIQFYSAMEASSTPGFKQTGASPMRLGHFAVISPEGDKLISFFRDFLGFWYTDDIGGIANFFTCNREHHVINIVKVPESRIHHIAFELRESSCHPIAADAMRAAGVNLLWGPARHTAGHNLASYHHDPDKVMIEFYTDMDTFIPELGMCEPRPWHDHLPMKPRSWGPHEVNVWGLEFGYNLAAG